MATAEIKVHPAAAIFPMMSDEEIAELATSIKAHGLRELIRAIPEPTEGATNWIVLDGRNRLEAIRRHLDISDLDIIQKYMIPVKLEAMFASPEEYVLMANIERRNLTQAQRRELAGKLALMIEEAQKDKPKEEKVDSLQVAADKAGVSRRTAATSKQQAKKPETVKQHKKTLEKKSETSPKPGMVIARLTTSLTVVKNFSALKEWKEEEVKEGKKLADDINTLLGLEIERRDKEAIEAAKAILAAAENA